MKCWPGECKLWSCFLGSRVKIPIGHKIRKSRQKLFWDVYIIRMKNGLKGIEIVLDDIASTNLLMVSGCNIVLVNSEGSIWKICVTWAGLRCTTGHDKFGRRLEKRKIHEIEIFHDVVKCVLQLSVSLDTKSYLGCFAFMNFLSFRLFIIKLST